MNCPKPGLKPVGSATRSVVQCVRRLRIRTRLDLSKVARRALERGQAAEAASDAGRLREQGAGWLETGGLRHEWLGRGLEARRLRLEARGLRLESRRLRRLESAGLWCLEPARL